MNPALIGETVNVYRILHRDTWSLTATTGPRKGRVIGYSDAVDLADPVLTVSEASVQVLEVTTPERTFHKRTTVGPEAAALFKALDLPPPPEVVVT